MALTITKLRNRIALALGGSVSSKIDQDDIVNEAGRLLCTMHPWKFLERAPATVNFVSGQAYVAMPTDFGTLINVEYNADALNRFTLATFDEIAALRAENITPPAEYFGAIVHPSQVNATTAPAVPRIELAPTPTANITDALSIWYRSCWTEMTYSSGNEVPNVPDYVHSLLSELVAAVAMGYNERDAGSMSMRLAEIEIGPLAQNAKSHDGMIQPHYGWLGPGAVATPRARDPINWTSVADPS